MRPVNKGKSPYQKINDYSEALPYLEKRLGGYCSYCEFPIKHVPEVEHIASKANGGDRTDWNNLLWDANIAILGKAKDFAGRCRRVYMARP